MRPGSAFISHKFTKFMGIIVQSQRKLWQKGKANELCSLCQLITIHSLNALLFASALKHPTNQRIFTSLSNLNRALAFPKNKLYENISEDPRM